MARPESPRAAGPRTERQCPARTRVGGTGKQCSAWWYTEQGRSRGARGAADQSASEVGGEDSYGASMAQGQGGGSAVSETDTGYPGHEAIQKHVSVKNRGDAACGS